MAAFHAVTRTHYGTKRWKKISNLFFAQQDNVVPVGLSEFAKTILSTVVGFLTINDKLMPAALQGLINGQNWFVDQNGKWQGEYLPAIYGCYPFQFLKAENGELVLCIDEESGLVTEGTTPDAEPFFDSENNPSPIVAQIMANLNNIEADMAKAQNVCALLQKYELFEPWPIEVKGDQSARTIEGLFRINEQKLNSLPAEALLELRSGNALLVAYGQLFSMHNLSRLGRLGSAYNKSRNKAQAFNPELGLLEDTGSISFDNL